eukprot:CAMPEP_0203758054 /NCGR_PEP_ID=MMETSP0098-20131031/10830_1 /ASSEMBLY_ACC=CAM_ASM_000208 /TAXON_ID=96639 /ORGANISM=" , Strain NY0313808BC1" /LENGTH=387 /DNA_ID=CAMNT_0050650301 /DNA_START=38 /DNA_END=1204 /DNA_ORIENTATION=+
MRVSNHRVVLLLLLLTTFGMLLTTWNLVTQFDAHHRQIASEEQEFVGFDEQHRQVAKEGIRWSGPNMDEYEPQVVNSVPSKGSDKAGGKQLRVAFAITITKDGDYLDGAAVLKESIGRIKTVHEIHYVAIVHVNVSSTLPKLKKLGYEVFSYEAPVVSSEIEGEYLRKEIDKSGCCGALELLKLRAYTLPNFDRVVLLDMDTLFVKSIDHLYKNDVEIQFTYDYAMHDNKAPAPPVQGGMLLIKPSQDAFNKMVDIVRKGDFRENTGWGGTGIGWCWGGQTIQGLVSYYYNIFAKESFKVLDPCKYNAMVTTDNCKGTPFADIYSIHYTQCQKPWDCRPSDIPLCRRMVKEWWDVRRMFERKYNLPLSTTDGCKSKSREYKSLNIIA